MKEKSKARIDLYFHCQSCLENEIKGSGLLAVGWTKEGIQVYCEKCEKNVFDIDFKGQKVGYYKKPKLT